MSDIEEIKSFIKSYDNERIYLWTDYMADSILHTARLLFHLTVPCNNIFIIDFPINVSGRVFYRMGEVPPIHVDEIAKHFNKLTDEDFTKFVELWRKIKSGNSMLRILDENGQILEKEESYYDSLIISYVTNEFQPVVRIIGDIFCDNPNVCDFFLDWRFKQLSLKKKIEIRGKFNYSLQYEVKIQ